jgi:integrase
MLYYRTREGRERRPKLGSTAVMSLTDARARARKLLLQVANGEDPQAEVFGARESPRFKDFAADYMKRYARKEKKKSSADKDEEMLDAILIPKWGKRTVASIRDDDVQALREAMHKTPIQFNRVWSLVSRMFNLAEGPGWRLRPHDSNPVKGVARYPEKKRRRYMRAEEAKAIAALLDLEEPKHPAPVAFLRLLILTGARKGEIARARWEWLDGNVLRDPDSKTGERDIYLSPAALEVIEKLPRTSGTLTGIQSPQKVWCKIRKKAGCPDLRLHDLRHSFASVALSLGLTLGQIGELLGHKSTQTTQRYAHLIEEHKQAAAVRTAEAITERMLPAKAAAEVPA